MDEQTKAKIEARRREAIEKLFRRKLEQGQEQRQYQQCPSPPPGPVLPTDSMWHANYDHTCGTGLLLDAGTTIRDISSGLEGQVIELVRWEKDGGLAAVAQMSDGQVVERSAVPGVDFAVTSQ